MKAFPLFAAILLAAFLTAAFAEESAAEDQNVNLEFELLVVSMPQNAAIAIVREAKDPQTIETAYSKVQEMLLAGTARLIGWPFLITKSGLRAQVEAIDEVRYATEYEPPTVAINSEVDPAKQVEVKPRVDMTAFVAIPTSFETRNTGVTFEVEPVLRPDGKLHLNLVPQHVRLQGYRTTTLKTTQNGVPGSSTVEQPNFQTNKLQTSLTMAPGQRLLLGTFPAGDPKDHLELFFFKAEVRRVP